MIGWPASSRRQRRAVPAAALPVSRSCRPRAGSSCSGCQGDEDGLCGEDVCRARLPRHFAGGIRWVRNDAGLGVLEAARPRPRRSRGRVSASRRSKVSRRWHERGRVSRSADPGAAGKERGLDRLGPNEHKSAVPKRGNGAANASRAVTEAGVSGATNIARARLYLYTGPLRLRPSRYCSGHGGDPTR